MLPKCYSLLSGLFVRPEVPHERRVAGTSLDWPTVDCVPVTSSFQGRAIGHIPGGVQVANSRSPKDPGKPYHAQGFLFFRCMFMPKETQKRKSPGRQGCLRIPFGPQTA